MVCFIYSGSGDDMNKRRFQRTKDFKDIDKSSHGSIQDRSSNCKFLSLKIVLVCIIFCTFVSVLYSPAANYYDNPTKSTSRYAILTISIWPVLLDL